MTYRRALHVFRRDLRLEDNTALREACARAEEVRTCFIFDPRQVGVQPYRGWPSLQVMVESLRELQDDIGRCGGALELLWGDPQDVLLDYVRTQSIDAVFLNRDYTPFARNRDRAIHEALATVGVTTHQFGDALLHEPEEVLKDDGKPYTVYTPFMKRASKIAVRRPQPFSATNLTRPKEVPAGDTLFQRVLPEPRAGLFAHGGRRAALEILERINTFADYQETRDFPARESTTGLGAHHKFGTVSLREVYWRIADRFGVDHTLIRELWWRDFFTHIAFHFPHVFRGSFHRQYDQLEWENNEQFFARWCEGTTGFPIVDAGMRQLNETGFMHNRVRMIVASFLTKDLLIDWRWGERYFATRLVDYDPAVNNGSWQWAASTGCDAQPYFRIFNPWLQQERFDAQGEYVRRWVRELSGARGADLHAAEDGRLTKVGYPAPIVSHAEQKAKVMRLFAAAKESANGAKHERSA